MPLAAAVAIAGVASAGAGIISANKASMTARQTAEQNNRIAQQNRQQNIGLLQPSMDRGNAAGERLNALLGLGGGSSGGFDANAYLQANPDVAAEAARNRNEFSPEEYARFHFDTFGRGEGRSGGVPAQSAGGAKAAADEAFNAFRNSTGYQFRVGEGERGVNAGFAGRGMLQSGAALKEMERFRQGIASQEFGNYANLLDNQQRIGVNAMNGLVNNNNNTANAVIGNNDSAGQARANAQLATGAAIGNGLSSIVNAFGMSRGSSYGGGSNSWQPGGGFMNTGGTRTRARNVFGF
jgi:hypothetical protein